MRDSTVQRMHRRVEELESCFSAYCDQFDDANLFTGPSRYFHFKTLTLLRKHSSVAGVLQDEVFFESLYATLTAWEMHRMGDTKTKLVDFPEMVSSFREQTTGICELASRRICELAPQQVTETASSIWSVLARLRIGVGETKIVAGSKALHHLLPELVPPVDREYTIRFFYHNKTLNRGDEVAFTEIYPCFHRIALACKNQIEARIGRGMHTSTTKVIDNAIVGYGLKHLKTGSP